jgi:hypothetical protein
MIFGKRSMVLERKMVTLDFADRIDFEEVGKKYTFPQISMRGSI